MSEVSSNTSRSLFVELFYAVVVGSAFPRLGVDGLFTLHFFATIFLILVILEDFFMYYRHVAPADPQGLNYTWRSLLFEFSILLAWYIGVLGIPMHSDSGLDKLPTILGSFSAFYLIKLAAGASFQSRPYDWRFYRDLFFLIPVGAAAALYFYSTSETLRYEWVYGFLFLGWTIQAACWWTLTARRAASEAGS